MKKVLFLIDTLGGGGAEKVLVTLANGLCDRYDITVQTIFDEGVYREALPAKVKYKPGFSCFEVNFRRIVQRVMKYMPARILYRWFITEEYDCEVAFLEGASTKIISGGTSAARRLAWVHIDLMSFPGSIKAFYPIKSAFRRAYNAYDKVCCVSQEAKKALCQVVPGVQHVQVVYNPVNVEEIEEKAQIPENLNWIKKCFTFCAVGRLVEQKGFDLFGPVCEELKGLNAQFIILGTGAQHYEDMFRYLSGTSSNIRARIEFSTTLSNLMYAGADMFLMPSAFEPCGLSQLIALKYGTIPVVRATGGLEDTITGYPMDNGNGFKFWNYSPYAMMDCLKYAIDIFKDKKDWKQLIKNAMNADFSWDISAQKYVDAYKETLAQK